MRAKVPASDNDAYGQRRAICWVVDIPVACGHFDTNEPAETRLRICMNTGTYDVSSPSTGCRT